MALRRPGKRQFAGERAFQSTTCCCAAASMPGAALWRTPSDSVGCARLLPPWGRRRGTPENSSFVLKGISYGDWEAAGAVLSYLPH
ncbi:small integral membrane protein 8 isoform X5 [Cavia porcellus]|uniref:small integral membrane protein 8 isoform X5 n=1 Tax=Cavia porcellus TaxID=10141 RepID=UPI002FE3F50F